MFKINGLSKYVLLGLMFWGWPHIVAAELPQAAEHFHFEVRVFDWIPVMQVQIDFEPLPQDDQLYLASIKVRPQGMVRFLSGYKDCKVFSTMRFLPEKNRFRLEALEKQFLSSKQYRGVYQFDYQAGVVSGQGFIDGKPLDVEYFDLKAEEGIYYDDFLSFLYNFRTGAYGELQPGNRVKVYTLPTRPHAAFEMEVMDPALLDPQESVQGARHIVSLNLNEKILGVHVDRFLIWLSKDFRPLHSLAKNVVGWGDVAGNLKRDKVSL